MIERCRETFPVSMMCRLLNVSSSGYYEWRTRKPSALQQDNARLMRNIHRIHQHNDGVFGSLRIWEELRYDGECCSLNRVARLVNSRDRGHPSGQTMAQT